MESMIQVCRDREEAIEMSTQAELEFLYLIRACGFDVIPSVRQKWWPLSEAGPVEVKR